MRERREKDGATNDYPWAKSSWVHGYSPFFSVAQPFWKHWNQWTRESPHHHLSAIGTVPIAGTIQPEFPI
jgi:hypothetical protein